MACLLVCMVPSLFSCGCGYFNIILPMTLFFMCIKQEQCRSPRSVLKGVEQMLFCTRSDFYRVESVRNLDFVVCAQQEKLRSPVENRCQTRHACNRSPLHGTPIALDEGTTPGLASSGAASCNHQQFATQQSSGHLVKSLSLSANAQYCSRSGENSAPCDRAEEALDPDSQSQHSHCHVPHTNGVCSNLLESGLSFDKPPSIDVSSVAQSSAHHPLLVNEVCSRLLDLGLSFDVVAIDEYIADAGTTVVRQLVYECSQLLCE